MCTLVRQKEVWNEGERTQVGCELFGGSEVHTGKKEGLSLRGPPFSHNRSHHQKQPHHRQGVSEIPQQRQCTTKSIMEAIAIKKTGAHAMNHDGGCYQLSQCYIKLLLCDARVPSDDDFRPKGINLQVNPQISVFRKN